MSICYSLGNFMIYTVSDVIFLLISPYSLSFGFISFLFFAGGGDWGNFLGLGEIFTTTIARREIPFQLT